MSVILQLGELTVSQGWDDFTAIAITNSGDENIQKVYIKVTDTAVFDVLKFEAYAGVGPQSALNQYIPYRLRIYTTDALATYYDYLPASTTRYLRLTATVKDAAPIQTHNLVNTWKYICY